MPQIVEERVEIPKEVQVPYPVEVEKIVHVPYDVERIEYVDVAVSRAQAPVDSHKNSIEVGLLSKHPVARKLSKLKEKKLKELGKLGNKLIK